MSCCIVKGLSGEAHGTSSELPKERKGDDCTKDQEILELYRARSETAISETEDRYGRYCRRIAVNILGNREDAQECVNDTFLTAWNSIPPQSPRVLATFLGSITRNLAIDRWRERRAGKRGGGEMQLALDELSGCVPGGESPEGEVLRRELLKSVAAFLGTLPETERSVFLCRYWYFDSAQDIALHFGFSSGKVRSMLHRTRKKLQSHLKREGLL